MSSVEYLREFVSERLTAAAEEILFVFKTTVVEYQQEIDRQRRLLDIVWKPEVKLQRIELPQQHVCREEEEEVLCDQQHQERNSSLDQEDPEPPQIKEEQEKLCTSQEGEQLELKQETETFMSTPTYEDRDHGEDHTLCLNPDDTLIPAEKESLVNIAVRESVVSEPDCDRQLPHHNSHVTESQDQKGGKHEDKSRRLCNTHTGKNRFKCDTCGKAFKFKSKLKRHIGVHTGEKPYSCTICGKRFKQASVIHTPIRVHTGEKPYICRMCGKAFRWTNCLTLHMRTHSGERPYNCKVCGRDFRSCSNLKDHMRTHT